MKQVVFLLLFLFLLSACRYGKPLFVSHEHNEVRFDSLDGTKEVTKEWSFLCLRTGIHTGSFSLTKVFDKKNRLIEVIKYKNTWVGVCDGPNKWITKAMFFDTLGNKIKVHYSVVQDGFGSTTLVDTTIVCLHKLSIKN